METVDILHANHVGVTAAATSTELLLTANTVSVFYNAGWPVSRPAAPTVLAFGHTSAPSWLTASDVWFEAV
jgi:hypothetical protein